MNYLVKCSPAVANTRGDGSGVRRVRIDKGTAKERLVEIDRHGMKFPSPLPPEILADSELIREEVASEKPKRKAIETEVTEKVMALEYAELVELAKANGIDTARTKKAKLQEELIAKLSDEEKAGLPVATAEETAAIAKAEGVEVGDVLELPGGETVKVTSLDGALEVEPVEAPAAPAEVAKFESPEVPAPASGASNGKKKASAGKAK